MYKTKIQAISRSIRKKELDEIERFVRTHVTEFQLRWVGMARFIGGMSAGHVVWADAPVCTKYKIVIHGYVRVSERLHVFIHEALHVFYAVEGIPKQDDLSQEDHCFLEDEIEALTKRLVSKNRGWASSLFEKCYGFLPSDFAIFNG